jgi:hypothetical protein
MQGRILGHTDVVTDLLFVPIQTLSFKQRKSTKFCLNRGGALIISNVNSTESDCESVRREKQITVDIGLVGSPFQHTCLKHLQDCVVNGD